MSLIDRQLCFTDFMVDSGIFQYEHLKISTKCSTVFLPASEKAINRSQRGLFSLNCNIIIHYFFWNVKTVCVKIKIIQYFCLHNKIIFYYLIMYLFKYGKYSRMAFCLLRTQSPHQKCYSDINSSWQVKKLAFAPYQ